MSLTFSRLLILAYFHLLRAIHWHAQAHTNHVRVTLSAAHQGQLNPVICGLCAALY